MPFHVDLYRTSADDFSPDLADHNVIVNSFEEFARLSKDRIPIFRGEATLDEYSEWLFDEETRRYNEWLTNDQVRRHAEMPADLAFKPPEIQS